MQSLDKAYDELGQEYGIEAARTLVAAEAIGRDIRELTAKVNAIADLAPDFVASVEPIDQTLANFRFHLTHTVDRLTEAVDRLTLAVEDAGPKPTLLGRLFFKKGR